MDLGLSDRAYVVTGGSTGLGFATARCLVDEGARVVVVSRSSTHVDAAVATLGDHAVGLAGDLASESIGDDAVDLALAHFGRLDGGLISVGGPPAGSVLSTTDEQWRAAFDSVFLGSIRVARSLCRGVTDSGHASTGAIAWTLSTSSVEVFTGLTTSNGTRPGLAMIVKDLADEVGPSGLRIVGLLPGRIETERIRSLDAATGDADAARERSEARIPLRRYGDPAEFGRVAAFVMSPAASYVTGTLIRIDGGTTRHP